MKQGGKFLAATAVLSISGCGAENELQIRSLPAPISATAMPVPFRIAEANGHLLLGNVALALESYRKALRDDPRNVYAMVGMAACYDTMARFDLSRRYYESALAVSPADADVLQAFAASLELQGLAGAAVSVRKEIATRLAAEAGELSVAAELTKLAVETAAHQSEPATQRSVTVALPPARPDEPVDLEAEPRAPAHSQFSPPPSESVGIRETSKATPEVRGLRLERLSFGEVALLTRNGRQWRPQLVHRTGQSTTVRFVPLKRHEGGTSVRLLNAARAQGLAARTRSILQRKGWQRITIGDADRMRDRSLVLYSPPSEQTARRLSKQFGFDIAREPRSGGLTVLLGRDAVRLTRSRG